MATARKTTAKPAAPTRYVSSTSEVHVGPGYRVGTEPVELDPKTAARLKASGRVVEA